jgi:hypothetical protein
MTQLACVVGPPKGGTLNGIRRRTASGSDLVGQTVSLRLSVLYEICETNSQTERG